MSDIEESLADCRILIVEDHRLTADIVQRAMQDWLDVHCTAVGTLAAAIEEFRSASAATEVRYHVILCDLVLPDGSGLVLPEVVRSLMHDAGRESRTQLVAISGSVGVDDEAESLAAGFDAHLRKPFTLAELVGLVNRLLKRSPCATAAASA